jgi:hypothetical protein
MTAWVGVGIALMILGVYTTLWVSFLGAAVVGSTPVFFTLRSALAPKQTPKPPSDPPGHLPRATGSAPGTRRRTPPRRRGHGW